MQKHILVIDDEESVRMSFTLALESPKYKVDTVDSGEKGLIKVKDHKYDLIFLDLKMPGLNGVETLKKLRKINNTVPVYIVTAFHNEFFDQLKNAIDDGIDFFLVNKPIGSDQISLIAEGVLEGAKEF